MVCCAAVPRERWSVVAVAVSHRWSSSLTETTPGWPSNCLVYEHTHTHYTLALTGAGGAVADTDRSNLMEFGRYVQEMLPKYIQQTQITFRFITAQYTCCM